MIFERTVSSVWMMSKVTAKYSAKFRFTQTQAGAGDQDFLWTT